VLKGGDGDDEFVIFGANESVNDTILGGAGLDRLINQSSADFVLSGFDSSNPLGTASGSGIEVIFLFFHTLLGTDAANTFDFSQTQLAAVPSGGVWNVDGRGGDDTIVASFLSGNYRGGAGDDDMTGGVQEDALSGDAGNDTLTGGGGADVFVYAETGAANRDLITDYAGETEGDVLDLTALLDANYSGGSTAGFVRAIQDGSSGNTLVQVDTDGGGDNWQDVTMLQGYYNPVNDILVKLETTAFAQTIHAA
jgi:Ca2+-binding RTX toxin-like protein